MLNRKILVVLTAVFGFFVTSFFNFGHNSAEAKSWTFNQYLYYTHENKIKLTRNVYISRQHIIYPLYKSRPDAVVKLKKGSVLKVVYPGTTWSWVIVGDHRFPKTKKHLWTTNKGATTYWFKVLHHYKSSNF